MTPGFSRSLTALLGATLLLVGALVCAGENAETDPVGELRAGIQREVADPARATTMLTSVDEIEAVVAELELLIRDERAALAELLRDPESTRQAVDASLEAFNSQREALARRALAAHAALKAQATAAEWKKLRKLETDMVMYVATRSLGQAAPAGKES